MPDKTTLALLKNALALISNPRCWTQRTQERKDKRVPGGVRYCAIGALIHCAQDMGMIRNLGMDPEYYNARGLLEECVGGSIVTVNDGTHRKKAYKNVLEAFECAIEKAEKKEVDAS